MLNVLKLILKSPRFVLFGAGMEVGCFVMPTAILKLIICSIWDKYFCVSPVYNYRGFNQDRKTTSVYDFTLHGAGMVLVGLAQKWVSTFG